MTTTPHPGLTGLHMAIAELERMVEASSPLVYQENEVLGEALDGIKQLYADVLAGMFPVEKSEIQEVIENSDRYLHIVKNLTVNIRPGKTVLVGIKIPERYKVRVTGLDHCIDRLMAVEALDNAMALMDKLGADDKCELCNSELNIGDHNIDGKGDCIPF